MNTTKKWSWKTLMMAMAFALIAMPAMNLQSVQAEDEDESETAKHMSIISKNFKKLRRMISDPGKNKDSIALIDVAIKHCIAVTELAPPIAEKAKGTEKEKIVEGYKKLMVMLTEEFGNMKKALEANKNGDAATSYKKMLKLKKAGHEAYTE